MDDSMIDTLRLVSVGLEPATEICVMHYRMSSTVKPSPHR
jgi:hypothetical protein